jgi:TRAP-type C4-dicarboxylate transport system permease small subunit
MTGLRYLDLAAESLVVFALLAELVLVLANVAARVYFQHSFLWTDEVARLVLSVLAFVGGAVAYRRRDHAFVRVILSRLPRRGERACLALADVVVLFVAGLTAYVSLDFLASSWGEYTPIFQMPAALIALPLPVGMALIMLYAGVFLRRDHGAMGLGVGAGFAAVVGIAALTRDFWLPLLGDNAAIIAALTLFFAAILAGVPVGFVLLLSTATYLWGTGTASLVVLPQTMVNGTGAFILLAVPFFILAGLVMERGGISLRLVRFIHALVGHMTGGLLQVTVASMYVVSGLSGSKPADVAAVGTVMRDELAERHGAAEGGAVLAASAVMGETVPPQHRDADRRLHHQRVGRRHVHRRTDPGGGNGAVLDDPDLCPGACERRTAHRPRGPSRRPARRRERHPAAPDAGKPSCGHPVWHRHPDRDRRARRGVRPPAVSRDLSRNELTLLHRHRA